MPLIVQIFGPNNRRRYVSTVNPEKSNWFRYLRPAPSRDQRNLAVVFRPPSGSATDDEDETQPLLYFVSLKNIDAGEELLFWTDDPDLMWTRKRAEKKSKILQDYSRLNICVDAILTRMGYYCTP